MDVNILRDMLLGSWADERLECQNFIVNSNIRADYSSTVSEQRNNTLQNLKKLAENNIVSKAFPTAFGGENNYGGHVASFEELIAADPSLQIKAGVQYGLFAAAIQHLGTAKHHRKFLKEALELKILGSYGMTESGHGSDVFNIKTTATFKPSKDGFIINTPDRSAWKDYLGNAALHANWVIVFAQLIIEKENYGVHGFLVPIRDDKGNLLEGVYCEDNGLKGGLNGIDNGRLAFKNIVIPRENLLDRYGSVSKYGIYSSKIDNPIRRFFIMLGTLVQGRVSLDGAAVVAAKIALEIAIKYGNARKQFKSTNGEEILLMEYPSHQARLIPLVAETYAASFAHEELLQDFDAIFSELSNSTGEEIYGMQDLETFAAAMKSSNTWHALQSLQAAREACGGNGFLSENNIVDLKKDFDVYVTFEGDNTVLAQLVGKRILKEYSEEFKKLNIVDKILKIVQLKFLPPSMNANMGSDNLHEILKSRVDALALKIMLNINSGRKEKKTNDAIFFENQNDIIALGESYADYKKFDAFYRNSLKFKMNKKWEPLDDLLRIYGLNIIKNKTEHFISLNIISKSQIKHLDSISSNLLTKLNPHMLTFVEAFNYAPKLFNPPMLQQ
jgi:acyl-CoA oxidase